MATVETSPTIHSPPVGGTAGAQRPRGILKNSFRGSPPVSPTKEREMTEKELTVQNTHQNAGHRRSSSTASRPAASRRQSSRTPSTSAVDSEDTEGQQRLKWDEANLYLTEQERSSTMKITEPKTPYAKQYEPSEDDEDEDMADNREEIPDMSLGEPEEEIPEGEFAPRKSSKVHVSDEDTGTHHDAENEYFGMTPEEREKHRRFEELRKKHYEMREAVGLLGHPEDDLPEDEDDEDEDGGSASVPPVPKIAHAGVNGQR